MGKKKANYNPKGIEKLPNDKTVLYRIETASGNPNYVGVAKRSRVNERLTEHLGKIPLFFRSEVFSGDAISFATLRHIV